jgi:pimeloyl-ACP methyl ester carboxylesterase
VVAVIRKNVRIDIDTAEAKGEQLFAMVTIISPVASGVGEQPVVWFAWPGGGYNRHYFDLKLPGRHGFSEAEFHASKGSIFVACDHIGVGDSAIPAGAFNHSDIARTSAAVARAVIAGLRDGSLISELPAISNLFPLAIGQSYGGLLLTHLQAEHRLFKGVAMLGWSGICTMVKDVSGLGNVVPPAELEGAEALRDGLNHPYRRSFHFDDVPEDIVAEDLLGYPARLGVPVPVWGTPHMPGGPNFAPERGPLGPNVVTEEAAAIEVPVFIANGEIDTSPDPLAEPTAYSRSPDITTFVLPRASHMHNFAGTREILWVGLENWAIGVRDSWGRA